MYYPILLGLSAGAGLGMLATFIWAALYRSKVRLFIVAANAFMTMLVLFCTLWIGNKPASSEFMQNRYASLSPSAKAIVQISMAMRAKEGLGEISSRDFFMLAREADRCAPGGGEAVPTVQGGMPVQEATPQPPLKPLTMV